MDKIRKLKTGSFLGGKNVWLWIIVFAAVGTAALLFARAATPVTVDNSLPNPTNVRAYADDKVATITWEPPSDAGSKGIVGYYVTWGTGGVYTNAKQTTENMTQIQPLNNGMLYNVKVQSVHGSTTTVPTPGAHDGETAQEYRASGRVSSGNGATVTITPSSARVDQLRGQMTGFFDDFNTAAGAFDELKWNTAGSSCVPPSSLGAFINNQFHAHSQGRSSFGDYTYCDRGQVVNRPRAVFDTTGRTEANPGVITFDFDGVTNGRDAWYIDLVPLSARKSGTPLDITSHASIFDDDVADPVLFRIIQQPGSINFSTYDSNKNPTEVPMTYVNCPDFKGDLSFDGAWCGGEYGTQNTSFSPLAEPPINPSHPGAVANVRRHWRVEVSPTKIKLFVDGFRMLEANMPSALTNVRQWTIHNNIFTYNTGKDTPSNPTTSLLHWDNFGFNGPAPTTVTHNYIDGGPTGTQPLIGRGIATAPLPDGNRATKIKIPDPIGNPVKARLMFTFGSFAFQQYRWSSGDHVVINGKRYNYPDPKTNSIQPPSTGDVIADGYTPFADSIPISAADLKQDMNDIQLNLVNSGGAIYNVHIELEYAKGSQPPYTQPTDVFGASTLLAQVQPVMSSHDNYLFIEQNMGLPSGVISTVPGTTDATPPTVSITSPASGSSVVKGSPLDLVIAANDNVAMDKVEIYLDGVRNTTVTHSPFNHSLDTASLSTGNHTVYVKAFDTSGLSTQSSTISFTVTQQTPPPTTVNGDVNGDGKVNVFDLSTLLSNWGKSGASRTQGDLTGDGNVGVFDLSTLLGNWTG